MDAKFYPKGFKPKKSCLSGSSCLKLRSKGEKSIRTQMISATKIKKKIFDIAPDLFGKYPVLFAYLYGSYAAELVHPFSDLDIAVYTVPLAARQKLELEMSLALEIDRLLDSQLSSDVRILNELPMVVAGKVITEGVLVFSKDDKVRVEYETSLRGAYFDFLPFLAKYRQTFIESLIT